MRFNYYLFIALLLISFASADLGTFSQDECVNIKTILNATAVNISSISYPNGSLAVSNQPMTKSAYTFNYTFCDTSDLGVYVYDYFTSDGDVYVNTFSITYSGLEYTTAQGITSAVLVILLCGFLVLSIWFISTLPSKYERSDDGEMIGLSKLYYLKQVLLIVDYILIMFILFIGSNLGFAFLPTNLIAETLFVLFRLMFMLLPVIIIIWVLWIIVSLVKDKEMKRLIERGCEFNAGGKHEL